MGSFPEKDSIRWRDTLRKIVKAYLDGTLGGSGGSGIATQGFVDGALKPSNHPGRGFVGISLPPSTFGSTTAIVLEFDTLVTELNITSAMSTPCSFRVAPVDSSGNPSSDAESLFWSVEVTDINAHINNADTPPAPNDIDFYFQGTYTSGTTSSGGGGGGTII